MEPGPPEDDVIRGRKIYHMEVSDYVIGVGTDRISDESCRDGMASIEAVQGLSLGMDHGAGGLRGVLHLVKGLPVHDVDAAPCIDQDPGHLTVVDRDCDY